MEEFNSEKFDQYVRKLVEILPKHSKFLKSAKLALSAGTEQRPPSLILYTESNRFCKFITRYTSSHISNSCDDYCAHEMAKMLFIALVIEKIKYPDIAQFFFNLIKSIYRYAELEKHTDYVVVKYSEIKFDTKSSIFSVVATLNMLIFCKDDADINLIKPERDASGNTVYFCKNSPMDAMTTGNLMGMLKLEPQFSFSTDLYKRALGYGNENIFRAVDLFAEPDTATPYFLKKSLIECLPSDGKAFETICFEILHFLFSESFGEFHIKEQVPSDDRIRIRDFIIENTSPKIDFFKNLKRDGANYILWDAKNYHDELTPADLDTFNSYIAENKYFGRFGIILSRKGASSNLKKLIRDRMLAGISEILVLNEDDIISMIDIRALGRNPEIHLQSKLNDLRLST